MLQYNPMFAAAKQLSRLKFIIGFTLYFTTLFSSAAAQRSPEKELTIGDKVPDVELAMLNYPKPNTKLSAFKGKAIILDFWATWCSPCVASFPKMDSLQKKFDGKLQILPVTYQDKHSVDLLFKKMNANGNQKIKIPATVISDRQLKRLFPHNALPHYVWIDSDGIVKAITDMYQVTEANIQRFLTPTVFSLPIKKDKKQTVRTDKPVFIGSNHQINLRPDEILFENNEGYQSVLTGYNFQIHAGTSFRSNRLMSTNCSIKQLFQDAYAERRPEMYAENRIILNVKDSSLVTYTGGRTDIDSFKRWQANNVYCYEVIAPVAYDTVSKIGLANMQKDLGEYFGRRGISAKKEWMKRKCWVLRKIPSAMPLTSSGNKPAVQKNAFYYKLTNMPLTTLLNDLRAYYWQLESMPLIDETGLGEQPVDIEINAKMSSVEAVSKELARYGLVLKDEVRNREMIIIIQK